MIEFQNIKVKNFLSVGDNPITIDFTKAATTLITGSNGAGKSGIICDALSFALFGKSYRGTNKPKLINNVNNKGCLVTLEFNIGKKKYTIKRGMKPNTFEILESGKLLEQAASSKDQQAWLEEHLLKFNHKAFLQTILMGSMDHVPFMELDAAARRTVTENLLDIAVLSDMKKLLKEEVSTLKSALVDNDHQIAMTFQKQQSKKELIDKLNESAEDQIKDKKNAIENIKESAQKAKKEKDDLEKELDESDKESVIGKAKTLEGRLSDLRVKISRCETYIKERSQTLSLLIENESCYTCGQDIDNNFKENKTTELKEEINKLERAKNKFEDTANETRDNLNVLNHQLKAIEDIEYRLAVAKNKCSDLSVRGKELIDSLNRFKNESGGDHEDEKLKLVELESEINSLRKTKHELEDKQEVLELAQTLLKDSGIKASIIAQYLPILNKQVNHYLSSLDFNIRFYMDEEFKETLSYRFNDDLVYKDLSMGERQRLNLALAFAWRDIAKLKNSANTNLIVFDELFDSSIDSAGTKDLMKILNEFNKKNHVFVISHREGLESLFDEHLHFINVAGFTKLNK